MGSTYQHLHSTTIGATPPASEMMVGEIAVNTADGEIFTKNVAGELVPLGKKFEDFGLGVGGLPQEADWDAIGLTGFYTDNALAAVGEPAGFTGMSLMHAQSNPSQAAQLALRASQTPQAFIRGKSGGAWGPWTELNSPLNYPNFFDSRADAIAATVAAPVYVIAVRHGGVLLWYQRDAGGNALTTSGGVNWSPATGHASFLHWGAVGDGVVDDRTAIQTALASGRTIRNPRFMEFRVTVGFTVVIDRVDWEGGVIVYDRTTATLADGILLAKLDLTPDNHATCRIKDVDFLTKSQWIRWGIGVTYATVPGTVYNHSPNVEFSNIYSGAYIQSNGPGFNPPTQYFAEANLYFLDMHGVHLNSIFCDAQKSSGSTGQPSGTCGIRFRNRAGSTHTYVRIIGQDIHCRALDLGMEFTGSFEGLKLSQAMIVNCNQGVVINPTDADGDGTVSYETVGVFITNSHLNCEANCIHIYGAAEVYLSDLQLYGFQDTGEWAGIRIGTDNKYVRDFRIHDCTFSGGTGTTTVRNGIKLDQRCDRGKIFDNFGINLTQFCDVSTMTVVGQPVRVRDNDWVNKAGVLQASLVTQTSDNTKVSAAWGY